MKKIVFCLLAVIAINTLYAQSNTDAYYRTHPVWISMMSNESVNYYDAVKAFNLFWENKEKPTEENELFSASDTEKESKDFISSKMSLTEDAKKYAFEYKKFIYWQQDVLPFVKDDGQLMSKQEQLDIWKQQHEGRK
jgi:hypothetical protein